LQDAAERLRAGEGLEGSTVEALLPRLEAMAGTADATRQYRAQVPAAVRKPGRSVPEAASTPPEPAQSPAADAAMGSGTDAAPSVSAAPRTRAGDAHVPDPADELVRVSAERLDALLSAVGELIIGTSRIVERSARNDEDARRLEGATNHVASVVRRLRLRPFGDVCESLPRAVRDVAAAGNKEVELTIDGVDVEADRMVIDALRDPLLHLVRNAVDHGIEPPDERERTGKPRQGSIRVSAELAGGRMVVSVADDGAGLDEDAIRRTLRERGLPEPGSSSDLAEVLLTGGFSTRQQATAISGRGVGLDIVRSSLERIRGSVDVEWTKGRGTTFILECPPTPATLRAVLVRLGAYVYALPTVHVQRLRRVRTADLRSAAGGMILPTRKGPIRVFSLARLLGPPLEARPLEQTAIVVVASVGSRRGGFIVDEVLDEDELVMRPLGAGDGAVPHAAGATILPSGKVALVLAVPSLLSAGLRPGKAIAPTVTVDRDTPRLRILVADDSITTRTLEQGVLESAGYQVFTAVNGEDAWDTLQQEGADALVADVEMPRMDGFALCRRVRSSERFRELPIVLVTGLDSAADRARGLEAGADVYIAKASFDQSSLLEAVSQLIGRA
jgi:two-component system chemotaxis sensor kinase CheA